MTKNCLTDVDGLKVGQSHDETVRTGVTVVLPDSETVCAVDVRGGGPGTRETDVMNLGGLVDRVNAIVLSGGSVYGLAAADGVAAELGAKGIGYGLMPGVPKSPIVPSAILFDLANGGDKDWGTEPPYRDLGRKALAAAQDKTAQMGNAGAGYGALAGSMKGGTGAASATTKDGFTVGALVCVNSFGSVVRPGIDCFWAEPFEQHNEFGGISCEVDCELDLEDWGAAKVNPGARENTTLAVVATDAALTPSQAKRIAVMAQDGLARAIRPVHTPFDGDVVFALSTHKKPLGENPELTVARLGALAADTLARAVARGVYEAETLGDHKSWKETLET